MIFIKIRKYFSLSFLRNNAKWYRMQTREDRKLEFREGYWKARQLGASHKKALLFARQHLRGMYTHKECSNIRKQITNLAKETTKIMRKPLSENTNNINKPGIIPIRGKFET